MRGSRAILLRLAGHLCRLALGGIFLYAGALKALDPEGFAHEVALYGILTGSMANVFVYLMIPLEVAVGVALLLNFRTMLSLSAAAVLLVMFIGAIGFAIATDQPLEQCGCFGRNIPRTPLQTLLEDTGFLAAGLFGMAVLRKHRTAPDVVGRGRWKGALVATVALITAAFTFASPHLPIDDLATALRPDLEWGRLGVALAEADLEQGEWVVALLGMTEEPSGEAIEPLNALAGSIRCGIVGLYGDDDTAYNEFFWTRGPAFPLYHISSSDMRRLHRRLPRVFALKDGIVRATWDGIPTEEQVEATLR